MQSAAEALKQPADVWARIAAPVPPESISWRQDGKPVNRDGKFIARFVSYIDAGLVRERLDAIVPGEWDLTLTNLPNIEVIGDGGVVKEVLFAIKARLQVLGVVREDVGQGQDYKAAVTDAFKRAAVRFGIAHELYRMAQIWVELDGDGRYAKPIEDPAVVYARRKSGQSEITSSNGSHSNGKNALPQPAAPPEESCPKCGGRMYDNRTTKRNPRAPDFKCRDRSCDGVIWPPRPSTEAVTEEEEEVLARGRETWAPLPGSPMIPDDAEIPF